MSTTNACVSCCQMIHQAGIASLVMDVRNCACGAGHPCETSCATEYCMNGMTTVGDACDVCIQNSLVATLPDGGPTPGVCYSPVIGACQANADCVGYLTCSNGCP